MTNESMTPTPIRTKDDIIEAQRRQHEFRSKAKQEEWAVMEEEFDNYGDEDFDDEDERSKKEAET